MRLGDRIALALTGHVGPQLLRGLYAGLRFVIEGEEHLNSTWRSGQPVVFVAWHGRLLPLLFLYRRQGLAILVSQHRDGEYLARLARGLGYETLRGSSTRGGFRVLRQSIRAVRSGRSLAITPDGPQGPREQLKPGALQVARLTGAPVIPISAGSRQAWWIEGWDRFLVPKPFATVRVAVGQPCMIPRRASVGDLARYAHELESELKGLKARVDGRQLGA